MNAGYEDQFNYAFEEGGPSGASEVVPEIAITDATTQIDKSKYVTDSCQSEIEKLKYEMAVFKLFQRVLQTISSCLPETEKKKKKNVR